MKVREVQQSDITKEKEISAYHREKVRDYKEISWSAPYISRLFTDQAYVSLTTQQKSDNPP